MNNSRMIDKNAHVFAIYISQLRDSYISYGVGYCLLFGLWVFGDTFEQIIAIVPTLLLFIIAFFWELVSYNYKFMKKKLLFILTMLFIVVGVNAQSEITGFLGIQLTDKPYEVIDKLKKKNLSVEWKYPCIYVSDITFIDTKFKKLTITFNNDKLIDATFKFIENAYAAENPYRDKSVFLNEAKAKKSQLIDKLSQIFNYFGNTLCSKYGNPTIATNSYAVWKDSNFNSITLRTNINSNQDSSAGLITYCGEITIAYKTTNNNNEY